jgi:hypothetical protein
MFSVDNELMCSNAILLQLLVENVFESARPYFKACLTNPFF